MNFEIDFRICSIKVGSIELNLSSSSNQTTLNEKTTTDTTTKQAHLREDSQVIYITVKKQTFINEGNRIHSGKYICIIKVLNIFLD